MERPVACELCNGATNSATTNSAVTSAASIQYQQDSNQHVDLSMPVASPISLQFGEERSHGSHRGIDIAVPEGAPIGASVAGRVFFAGWNGNYGNTVLI